MTTDLFEYFLRHYPFFVTKNIFNTFMGYAIAQEKLLKVKTIRYKALMEMKAYLETVTDKPEFLSQDICDKLKNIWPDYRNKDGSIKIFNADTRFDYTYANIKREVDHYGYRKENILKHNYEIKFGSNLIRILAEGIELGETGKISYPLACAQQIKDIKEGRIPEKHFYEMVEEYKNKFRAVEEKCDLPECPDMDSIENLQIFMIQRYKYKRGGI